MGRVLAALHDNPQAPWTVGSLADLASMSRSAFAERFRSVVGAPPMRFLTELRLARAARLIRSQDTTLAEVARQVGYGSEESLSRAFKLHYGQAPTVFRHHSRVPRSATQGSASSAVPPTDLLE
jgi:transcriptional regulator GlxA family with amidase domain